ncbi:hypothetical protein [Nostoc sp. DedQUE07]|uniref:hypothetical protein n=1 Tax=Nostoc sp. DedQUE07 TaxID=3075392 RepID=UPI002AD2C71F|nr:hypothetical protein [Nostoc sp. DedQUE07]MDZ8131928.1 hypothetical protein [Nostoc sp. DedQUE07]
MQIKNHMRGKGKLIQGRMQRTFGIDSAFLIKCCEGDEVSLKKLGQMGREGALITKLMPKVQAAALATIQGTQDLNVGLAKVITQAASSSTAIRKASAEVVLAGQRYGNEQQELAATFVTSKKLESLRHTQTIDYIKLNAYIDEHMMRVDGDARQLEASYKPEIRQIDADAARREKVGDHLLKYGELSQPEVIPEKNYLKGGAREFLGGIKRAILGF